MRDADAAPTHPAHRRPAAEAVEQGLAAHREGKLADAITLYRQALAYAPRYFDALHMLGTALAQQSSYPEAIELLSLAVQIRPNAAAAYCNLGNAQREGGHPDEAIASYDRALQIDPAQVNALCGRGLALHQLHRYEEALASFNAALRIEPGRFDLHSYRGNALACLRRLPEAVGAYNSALHFQPASWEALFNRGTALLELKRPKQALASFDAALQLRPNDAQTLNNRGIALRELGNLPESLAAFEHAVAVAPDHLDSHSNRGIVLQALNRLTEALASFDRALQIVPDHADVLCNRGTVLQALNRLPEALACYDRALAIAPAHAEALNNHGSALWELKHMKQALAEFERAVESRPDYAEAHANIGMCQLTLGDLGAGWKEFEWRWRTPGLQRYKLHLDVPAWDGTQPLQNKSILLWADQGAGDTIQFCRFVQLLADRGARVLLLVDASLRGLLGRLPGVERILQPGEPLCAVDYHSPLMSLPLALGIGLDTIPAQRAYLHGDPQRIDTWAAKLGPHGRPRVGLAWSGNPNHNNDRNRSIPLRQFITLADGAFEFFCLQKIVRDADQPVLAQRPEIRQFCDDLADFQETAALIEHMDLVIAVDTSVAHLAGALGRPVWILLPFMPDWRWMLDREDSPWYPTARLFRQPQHGDWQRVLERVQHELATAHFPIAGEAFPPAPEL